MVKVEGIDKLLAEHPFFKDMPEDTRMTLAGCAKNERFEPGEYIAHEGQPADKFYLIRSGTLAVEYHIPSGDGLVIETLHTGEVFGWTWMVKPYEWVNDIRAVELARVISLDAACLRKKITKDKLLGFELYSRFVPIIAQRLSRTRQQLSDMYGQP
jgi:CRP-like cAMP-binding protein